jgi:hypothetical protein
VWQWKQTLGQYCAAIRDIPVDEIKTADILAVLRSIWSKTPETASRLRGRIEAVIDMARALGHIDEDKANPARWKGHLDHLLPPAKKLGIRGHHKALAYTDLPGLWTKLAEIDTTASRALMFTILTCARTSETLGMSWNEMSFAHAIWVVPGSRMKMQRPHDVLQFLGTAQMTTTAEILLFRATLRRGRHAAWLTRRTAQALEAVSRFAPPRANRQSSA